MRCGVLAMLVAAGCGDNTPGDVFPPRCDGGSAAASAIPVVVRGYDQATIAHTEPRIVPWGAGMLVQAWQAPEVGFASSTDAGMSWTVAGAVSGLVGAPGDVSLATDARGTVYLVMVQLLDRTAGTLGPLILSRLSASDTQFPPPVSLGSTTAADKPAVAFDSEGRLVVLYSDRGTGALQFVRAADASASTFGDPVPITYAGSSVRFGGGRAAFCVDRNRVAAAPVRAVAWPPVARLRERSSGVWNVDDTGNTLGPEQDPACVVDGQDVWIAYAGYEAPPRVAEGGLESSLFPADSIDVLHSPDGGLHFDQHVRVTPPASATKYLFPEMVLTPTGRLELLYYQGEIGGALSVMRSTSAHGECGTWSTQPLATAGSFEVSRQTDDWLGDYFGVVADDRGVVAAFTDNSPGSCLLGGTCSTISSVRYDAR